MKRVTDFLDKLFPLDNDENTIGEIRLYTNICLTCRENTRVQKVKQFARANNLAFKMKSAYALQEYRKEAVEIGAKMPFIYYNGKTLDFYSIDESLLVPDQALKELIK